MKKPDRALFSDIVLVDQEYIPIFLMFKQHISYPQTLRNGQSIDSSRKHAEKSS